ncbi:MAG: MarR family transcriptional regulator [Acidimicrobiales bacterium]
MKLVVTGEARAFRSALGVTAWAVLEELALEAVIDGDGALVAHTNVRAVAAQLGVSKDTAARAIARLTRASVVRRVVAERGARGALPTSSYVIDLTEVAGVSVDINTPTELTHATATAPSPTAAFRPCTSRPAPRVDDAQTSLFDLPASVS